VLVVSTTQEAEAGNLGAQEQPSRMISLLPKHKQRDGTEEGIDNHFLVTQNNL
jgi:hypothetical protein